MRGIQKSILIMLTSSLCCFGSHVFAQTEITPGVNAQLIVAARQGDLAGIQKSLALGAAPNSRNRMGKTPLFLGIEKNRQDMVQLMLDSGADVNMATVEMVTPLIAAAYAGNVQIVDLLLSKKPKL